MRALPAIMKATIVGVATLALGCAGTKEEAGGEGPVDDFVRAFENAIASRRVALPRSVRTLQDIRAVARARELAAGCVPGKTQVFPAEFLTQHRHEKVETSQGEATVGELATECTRMLQKLERRAVEACGARYVQLERRINDDDSWSAPRIARTSEGWYMTPCDRTPGASAGKDLKEVEEVVQEACDDPKASLYLLAKWTDDPSGQRRTATVACLLPRHERTGWLPGNPALGIK
jgi:hypothetical protein